MHRLTHPTRAALVTQTHTAQHSMLVHKPILVPLLHLLEWANPHHSASSSHTGINRRAHAPLARTSPNDEGDDVTKHFVLLLNQICTKMADNETLLEFFFDTNEGGAGASAQLSARSRDEQM